MEVLGKMEFELNDSLTGEGFEKALEEADALLQRGTRERNLELLEEARKKYSLAQLKNPKDVRAWSGAIEAIRHACQIKYADPVDAAKIRLSLVEMARVRSAALKIVPEGKERDALQAHYVQSCKALDALFPPRGKKRTV